MRFILYFLLLVTAGYTSSESTSIQQCKASSVGTNFVFGVIGFASRVPSITFYLHITSVTEVQANVRVTAPFVNMDRTYTVSNYTTVPLNGTLMQFESGKQFKGVEVSSDVNISVTVVTGYNDILEGFLALPVSALGTRYIAASYYPYSTFSSEILITGVESDTDITLYSFINGQSNTNRTFRLQKFETYEFKTNSDVSGSVVTSSKPVAVVSGSADAQVPTGIGGVQYLIEQMIPTMYWTKQFLIPPIYPRKHFVIKIFSDTDSTEVHYYNSTNHFAVYMDKGSMVELLFGTDPVVLLANKPVSVTQYGHDGDNIYGDPFMANTQGVSQFHDSYKFVTQSYYSGAANTIAITILKNSTDGLLLNGHSVSYWNAKNISVSHPMNQYIILFVNVEYNGYYHLYNSGDTQFGAVIYGRPSASMAYGYPLQLQLSTTDIDCANHAGSFTKNPALDHTTASTYSNQTDQEEKSYIKDQRLAVYAQYAGKVQWCFKCDGMSHLQFCDEVQKCQTPDEVCYVQKYPRSTDVSVFRSGCITREQCNSNGGASDCKECCQGNFCNNVGCGDKGLPARDQRGPICFECTHIGEDEDCNTVQLCHSNQACIVNKYEWGDNQFYYIVGCTDFQVCSTKRYVSELTKRHVPVCSHCCHTDFCNMNCTSGDAILSLVG